MDLGARIAGIGGLVAALAFFLPMYSGINGVNMANGAGGGGGDIAWWFRLLFAVAAPGLLYFAWNGDLRRRVLVAAAQIAMGSVWGVQVFRIMTGGAFTEGLEFGWYALHLGMLAILVGGVVSVVHHTERLIGLR